MLKNGSLHSEEFFQQNYKEFENNNYECIRLLIQLLKSRNLYPNDDKDQKLLALNDLNFFLKYHSMGQLYYN
jgi:hypothetical protein